MKITPFLLSTLATLVLSTEACAADYLSPSPRVQGRGYSPAVSTEGGRIIWLAGESAIVDLNGKDIKGDPEAQVRTIWALIDQTLHRAGASVKDIVYTTTFITDPRLSTDVSKVRKEIFPDGKFPTSSMITVKNLATPGMQVEIQAVAVVGSR